MKRAEDAYSRMLKHMFPPLPRSKPIDESVEIERNQKLTNVFSKLYKVDNHLNEIFYTEEKFVLMMFVQMALEKVYKNRIPYRSWCSLFV